MKKYALSLAALMFATQAQATAILEKAIVECTISSQNIFEQISLNFVQTQDADQNIYEDYVLDHTYGELEGRSSDIFGRHEQVRERIFTSANADADGVIARGAESYSMIMRFEHSEVIVNLDYEGQDQDNFPTYTMSFEGDGPAYEITIAKVQEKLADSEHYNRFDNPLCVSHFDLNEFVTQ